LQVVFFGLIAAKFNFFKTLFQTRCVEILHILEGDLTVSPRVGEDGVKRYILTDELGNRVVIYIDEPHDIGLLFGARVGLLEACLRELVGCRDFV
jgi:hypothetical protein